MKFLIVGLGNIGSEYLETRHNIGFKVLDALAGASNLFFKTERYGDVCELKHKGRTFILLKPSTYMNLSGNAVRYWMQQEKIALENVLVIIKTEFSKIIGGFNRLGWNSKLHNQWSPDPDKNCFLFSLNLKIKIDLV